MKGPLPVYLKCTNSFSMPSRWIWDWWGSDPWTLRIYIYISIIVIVSRQNQISEYFIIGSLGFNDSNIIHQRLQIIVVGFVRNCWCFPFGQVCWRPNILPPLHCFHITITVFLSTFLSFIRLSFQNIIGVLGWVLQTAGIKTLTSHHMRWPESDIGSETALHKGAISILFVDTCHIEFLFLSEPKIRLSIVATFQRLVLLIVDFIFQKAFHPLHKLQIILILGFG